MTTTSILPDAPIRNGTSGKYKLRIKSVIPMSVNYEYVLVDADGKEYKAGHPKHFLEGELLRCMVYFKIENAELVVSKIHICNKQDLTTAIPETKRPQSKSIAKPKDVNANKSVDKPKTVNGRPTVDNPGQVGKSGLYYLRIVDREKIDNKYSYLVKDAAGHKFRVESLTKHSCTIGSIRVFNVLVSKEQGCEIKVRVVALCKNKTKGPKQVKKYVKHHVKRGRSSSSSRDWLVTPCVGDHFRLIYTPMGNKR